MKNNKIMYRKNIILFSAFVFLLLFSYSSQDVLAGQGCCSWHGGQSYCDTSVGRWVCNDGTYSPSCGCAYYPPKPVCLEAKVGNSGGATFETNKCNQDVIFKWNKGTNDDFYSVGISKKSGADPGPKSDTTQTTYTFKDIKPGKWYVNVKPGRSCGWGDTYYWEINVPEAKPVIDFKEFVVSEDERRLDYSVQCAENIEIDNGIGKLKANKGSITIHPEKDFYYTLTASNGSEKVASTLSIRYPLEPVKEEVSEAREVGLERQAKSNAIPVSTSDSDNDVATGLMWAIAGGGGAWAIRKYLTSSSGV